MRDSPIEIQHPDVRLLLAHVERHFPSIRRETRDDEPAHLCVNRFLATSLVTHTSDRFTSCRSELPDA